MRKKKHKAAEAVRHTCCVLSGVPEARHEKAPKKECKATEVARKACLVLSGIPEPRCQQAAKTCNTLLDETATPGQKVQAVAELALGLTHP